MSPWLVPAVLIEFLWLLSLLARPWKDNIVAFLAVFFAAFAVYLAAWARLGGRAPAEPRRGPRHLPVILGAGLLFRATVFFAPPSLSDDIHRYLWDGRVQAAGFDPYRYAPDDPALAFLRDANYDGINHKSVRTIYPPLAEKMFHLAAAARPTLAAPRVIFLAFDAALMGLLVLFLRRKGLPAENVVLYAWNPLVLVEFASSGHLDSLCLFFLFAGLYALDAGSPGRAGVLWAFSCLGKLGSLILLPWMLFKRSAQRAVLPWAALIALGYAAYLTWPFADAVGSLASGTVTFAKNWHFNASLYALLTDVLRLPAAPAKVLLFGAVGAAALWLAWRWPEDRALAYAGVVWAMLLAASPVVHPWYVVWLAPFLCFHPRWSGLFLTGLAALPYIVLRRYAQTGAWDLPVWVPIAEYGTALSVLAWETRRLRKKGAGIPATGPS